MRYTINQIIRDFETFVSEHGQLNQFLMKDPMELLNDHEGLYTSSFPVLDAVLRPSSFSGNVGTSLTVSINFDLYFMDLVHKDLSNEFEVVSDMQLCAMDFIAYFNKPEFDDYFTVSTNGTLLPFYEKGDNEMTGWTLSVSFKIIDKRDSCAIPS